jgi:mRNA interferase RelE/StbE
MPKKIIWSERAQAELRAIEQRTALRILHALARAVFSREGDIKRLKDIEPPEFRLRVGDYRVRFRESNDAIEIISVKHRREAYRWVLKHKKSPASRQGFDLLVAKSS